MTTKIVYVLVSCESDYYLEQNLISAFSCRLHNPDACIVLVLDPETYSGLKGKRSEIIKYVSDIQVVNTPPGYNGMQKSRYLKTNLRKFVSGDFLYIDSDTVISESLEQIDAVDAEIAAVYDSNRERLISETDYVSDDYIISHTRDMGWPSVVGYPNFNGGVLFCRDSEIGHSFYKRWYELWLECVKKGKNIDMAALCRTNIELGCPIKPLNGIWNCQIQRQGLPLLPNAKIIHCFTGGNITFYALCSERILDKTKVLGYLDDETKGLIGDAKNAFEKATVIVSSQDAKCLSNPINRLRYVAPSTYRILNFVARVILKLNSLFTQGGLKRRHR